MAEVVKKFGKAVLRGITLGKYKQKSEEEKSEEVKTSRSTEPIYYRTKGGITLSGTNLYEKMRRELEEEEKSEEKEEKKTYPEIAIRKELNLSQDIDFIQTNPKNPFFYVRANSLEEAKKLIEEKKTNLEKGYGIEINLKKLKVEKYL